MRPSIALLVSLAACASETPDDRLAALARSPGTVCMDYPAGCTGTVPIDAAVACMNDALTNGTRAMARWSVQDAKLYYATTYVFADAHLVKPFRSVPDDFGGDDVYEERPCTGTFQVSTESLCTAPRQQYLVAWTCN